MASKPKDAYSDSALVAAVMSGKHRSFVGGMWDEIGGLQRDFVLGEGLTPDMRLLDIGCGCLRAGVHFVRYLNAGNYYGIDISQALIDAGYEIELAAAGLQSKMPRSNLNCNGGFEASMFGVKFDVAIAQSVFTHLPLNHFKLCMARAADYMRPGGTLYATVFLPPDGADWTRPITHSPGGIVTYPDADPFHYQEADVGYAVADLPWTLLEIRDWNHPRNQKMAIFRRDPA